LAANSIVVIEAHKKVHIMKRMGPNLTGAFIALFALMTSASAADLGQGAYGSLEDNSYAYRAPIWTGLYVGLHGGYAFGKTSSRDGGTEILNPPYGAFACAPANYCDVPFEVEPEGGLVGVQIGYNQQYGALLVGMEAELGWLNANAQKILDRPANDQDILSAEYRWQSILALRAGYAVGQALIYAKGGLAFAKIDTFAADFDNGAIYEGSIIDTSNVETGWVAGGGVEYAIGSGISLKAEYLYADFGDSNSRSSDGDIYRSEHTLHTVKAGLNFLLVQHEDIALK
jgi:outer membrane immunogenic protein